MPIQKDMKALAGAMESGVKAILSQLIDGAITDLDGPIRDTAARLTLASRRGRQDLVDESRDQLALIIMEKERRLKVSGYDVLDTVLGIGLNALVNGAIAGLGALKAV